MKTLDDAAVETLFMLDDAAGEFWGRAEVELDLQEGYDRLVRLTRCIFDVIPIPNLPPFGTWSNPDQLHHALITPGSGSSSDRPMLATGEAYSRHGARVDAPLTQTGHAHDDSTEIITVKGARLPSNVIDVIRAAWDRLSLTPSTSSRLRQIDPTYESRVGDPRAFTMDQDGLQAIRFYPAASGDASYDTFDLGDDGGYGIFVENDEAEYDLGPDGGYGIVVDISDGFPSGGLYGHPCDSHPESRNFKVEVFRLGQPLTDHPFELPRSFVKYVEFYAAARLLERDGPGQDLTLAQHYDERFLLGVEKMNRRIRRKNRSRVIIMGGSRPSDQMSGPQLPSGYPAINWDD